VGCTFRPNISKSERSRTAQAPAPTPVGFNECKQRLRKAFAGQAQRRQILEFRSEINIP
ncbi:unnamed protein product, partial [Prorocentrum cordatum]